MFSDIFDVNGTKIHEEKTTQPSGDYTSIKETTSKTKHTILVEEKVGNTKQVETYNVTGKKTVAVTKATTNANNKIVTILEKTSGQDVLTFRLLMKDIQYMPRLVLRKKITDTTTCVISIDDSTLRQAGCFFEYDGHAVNLW